MIEEMLSLGRYKEKQTGKYWEITGFHTKEDKRVYRTHPVDDKTQVFGLTKEEIESRFDYAPFGRPVFKTTAIEPRHPILINLICPECGSPLKVKGGAILTSPLQYEHVCANKECHYHICTSSIYSGMYALVTDEQESHINNNTYSSHQCGEIIEITEKEAYLIIEKT